MQGKVLAVLGRRVIVNCQGTQATAIVRKSLLKEELYTAPVAAGDDVELSQKEHGDLVIEKVLPRRQCLARPDLHAPGRLQVLAANLDQLVAVCSLRTPPFKPGLVDRFLVWAEYERLEATVVINKIDLADPQVCEAHVAAWRIPGYRVIFTSAISGYGLDSLEEILRDKTSVLAGHSGVGKSSLLNRLAPSLSLRTREVSRASGRGQHTTSLVRLYSLPFGGWVADTPGLKVFDLSIIPSDRLADCFPEFRSLVGACRFTDCAHLDEPGCAIREALTGGKIAGFRYQSYRRLMEESAKRPKS